MYTFNRNNLTFDWPTADTMTGHIREILEACRQAATRSVDEERSYYVNLPCMDRGIVEGRGNRFSSGQFPATRSGPDTFTSHANEAYVLVEGPEDAPFYQFEIPGICQLIDSRFLAIAREFAWAQLIIYNTVFNVSSSAADYVPPSVRVGPYSNLPRTLNVLTKKPKIPKNTDFTPVFVALFGEKIATVIMKEIK